MPLLLLNGWHLGAAVGLGAFSGRLARGLLRQPPGPDWTVEILVPEDRFAAAESLLPAGSAHPLACPRMGIKLLDEHAWKNRLGAWCARNRPDAILLSPTPFWSVRIPRRVVVVHHDCIALRFPRYRGRLFLRAWLGRRTDRFLARCDRVVTQSQSARSDLVDLLGVPAGKIDVIPAWLPPEFNPAAARAAAPAVRARYGLPPRYWLYVGGYDYRKNVESLIAAYAAARAERACPPLVLAGRIPDPPKGPVCDVPGALLKAGLPADAVLTPGLAADADMPGLYGGAELLVYPSRYEGFGLPPLEAMGCGCPAIVADNSSLPEVVTDAGYRFSADDPAKLKALLVKAASAPLPLNPSFNPAAFLEEEALARYGALLRDVANVSH